MIRRIGVGRVARRIAAPVTLLLAAAGLAGATIGTGVYSYSYLALLVAFFTAHVATYGALTRWRDRLRLGWMAALPIRRHAAAQTLAFVVMLTLVLASMVVVGIEACVAVATQGFAAFPWASVSLIIALWAGVGVGALAEKLRERHARMRGNAASRVRDPLCHWDWPDDGRLTHLLAWQRRVVLLRWRTSGVQFVFGALLYVVPITGSARVAFGIVLLVLAILWLTVAARGCKTVAGDAQNLLAAVPLDARSAVGAGRRYPLIALACATAWGALGAWLLTVDRWEVFVIWCACAFVIGVPTVFAGPRFSGVRTTSR